jgi:hypothetical protein
MNIDLPGDSKSIKLLPLRAVLKLALFLPASPVVQLTLKELFKAIDWQGMIQSFTNDIIRGTRISPSRMKAYKERAKLLNRYAFVHHFGEQTCKETWERLFAYKGEFPPPLGLGVIRDK